MLIGGEAGDGKTALLRRFCDERNGGVRVSRTLADETCVSQRICRIAWIEALSHVGVSFSTRPSSRLIKKRASPSSIGPFSIRRLTISSSERPLARSSGPADKVGRHGRDSPDERGVRHRCTAP